MAAVEDGWFSRRAVARALGLSGIVIYNWWVLVPLRPGLMRSSGELFSNLEVTGHPFASTMQHADLLSGLLLLAAFAVAGGRSVAAGHREWLAMMVFAAAGLAGGVFPETCDDGISSACREMELGFRLPASQYLHIAAGIVEFGAITIALLYAVRRAKGERTRIAMTYRTLAVAVVIGYPLLGVGYLTHWFGGVIEALFFTGFTVLVLAQIIERTRQPQRTGPAQPEPPRRENGPITVTGSVR